MERHRGRSPHQLPGPSTTARLVRPSLLPNLLGRTRPVLDDGESGLVSAEPEDRNPGIAQDDSPYPRSAPSDSTAAHVREATVSVDAAADLAPLSRIWESIGYDEINWTYTATGRRLLETFRTISGTAFHVRPHYVFCSGTGFGLPHWGNGNVYHEDEAGSPFYDFTIVDQAYDAIVGAGHHVLVELAFTPRDLLPDEAADFPLEPSPTVYSRYEAGAWAFPPRDYERWAGLVRAHVQHCLDRYGREEVGSWLWELWNEPDISYWRGTTDQFCDLYTVTARAVRTVLPSARVGGPAVTGGGVTFLRDFLAHTSRFGDPIDFVSFHTKGSAFTPWRVYGPTGAPAPERQSPSAPKMLFEIRRLLRVIAEFPDYRSLPAIVDECDAGVPAHYSIYDNSNFAFQNSEYYPVFQVKLFKKILDLNELETVKVSQATSWSFYFEGERIFEGTRSFLTAGEIQKPLLNAYRMLARLGTRRLRVQSSAAFEVDQIDQTLGSSMPEEVDALASLAEDGTVAVIVWRHADDQYQKDELETAVQVTVHGLSSERYRLEHLRIDGDHSNSHTAWVNAGSPQLPSADQLAAIIDRQSLESLDHPVVVDCAKSVLTCDIRLPLPAASLLILEPR